MVIRSIIALIVAIGSLFAALTSDGAEHRAVAGTVVAEEMSGMAGCYCSGESPMPFAASLPNSSVAADAEVLL